MWECAMCNRKLVWQSDYDFEDLGIDDKEGIVSMYQCEPCGVWVEIYQDNMGSKEDGE